MPMTTRDPARRTAAMVVGLLASLGSAGVTMQPHRVLAQAETETEVNVELIMDSSGSMGAETNTGEPRIDAAKRVLEPGDRRDPGGSARDSTSGSASSATTATTPSPAGPRAASRPS